MKFTNQQEKPRKPGGIKHKIHLTAGETEKQEETRETEGKK